MTVDPVARQLHTAAECLGRLERDHRTVTANFAAGMVPVRSISAVSSDPDGAVTWTSVESAGNLRIHTQVDRYQSLIEHALVNLLEADLLRGLNVTANTTPIVEQDRCDGGAGDWALPSCEDNALDDPVTHRPRAIWVDGRQHQLCSRCWARARQRKSRANG